MSPPMESIATPMAGDRQMAANAGSPVMSEGPAEAHDEHGRHRERRQARELTGVGRFDRCDGQSPWRLGAREQDDPGPERGCPSSGPWAL